MTRADWVAGGLADETPATRRESSHGFGVRSAPNEAIWRRETSLSGPFDVPDATGMRRG